jgi:hypothetical protein
VSDNNQRVRRYVATAAIYLAVAASVFGFNVIRSRAARQAAQPAAPEQPTSTSTKPYFSLTTNRTYSPNETSRLWASYQNIEYLDFRVYRVKDPSKFFKQLDDPHQMGEKEKEAVSQGFAGRVSVLERAHSLKISLFSAVKDYVRTHLAFAESRCEGQGLARETAGAGSRLRQPHDLDRQAGSGRLFDRSGQRRNARLLNCDRHKSDHGAKDYEGWPGSGLCRRSQIRRAA